MRLDTLEVTVPTGDSYELTLEEMRLYFHQLGFPQLVGERALDRVWNFYAIRLYQEHEDYRIETLEPPQYPDVAAVRPLDAYAWVIERERLK